MGWLDLHIHSKYSNDGEYSPSELMKLCLQKNVRTVSIADHNSIKAIEKAKKESIIYGVTLIPAIELDCIYESVNLHVLGYFVNDGYEKFNQIENDILIQEQEASNKRIELIEKLGIYLNKTTAINLSKNKIVTGEIIAEVALNEIENKDNKLLEPYREGGKKSDNPFVNFYWDFCSQNKPAYVPIKYISLDEAIEVIYNSGGIPFLAHPGINIKENEELLHKIINRGIVGIETYSSYHTQYQTEFYKKEASKFDLAMSCGSDFHGKIKPKINIGSVDCGGNESELLDKILDNLATAHL